MATFQRRSQAKAGMGKSFSIPASPPFKVSLGKLFAQIVSSENIREAYRLIREKHYDPYLQYYKKFASGIDGVDLRDFDRDLEAQLKACRDFLLAGDRPFYPQILRKVPKDTPGKFREIYLVALRDKVVQKAMALPLVERFERLYYPNLFSYRDGRSYGTIAAARRVRKLLQAHAGRLFVYKTDIADYFDNIDQGRLLDMLREALPDEPEVRGLAGHFVHQRKFWDGHLVSPVRGIPAGSSLSTVFANFYLWPLDREMFRGDFHYLRYGDDILLLDPDPARIEAGSRRIAEVLAGHGLSSSPHKTMRKAPGEAFEYLGYRFAEGKIHIGSVAMGRFKQWAYEQLVVDRYRDYPNKTDEERRALLKKIVLDINTGLAATLGLRQLPWVRAFPVVDDDRSFRRMDAFIKDRIRLAILRRPSPRNRRLIPEAWFRELGYKSLTGAYHRILRRRSLAPYRGWRRYFGTNFEMFLQGREKKEGLARKWANLRGKLRYVRQALNGEIKFD